MAFLVQHDQLPEHIQAFLDAKRDKDPTFKRKNSVTILIDNYSGKLVGFIIAPKGKENRKGTLYDLDCKEMKEIDKSEALKDHVAYLVKRQTSNYVV